MENQRAAYLHLASGECFEGFVPAALDGEFSGEVVFNTGMVGYTECLTDPSYKGQILTFTYPLMGNYGVAAKDTWESDCIQAAGMIVQSLAPAYYRYHSEQSLLDWCMDSGCPVMFGVDTRALTRTLRSHGVIAGVISTDPNPPNQFVDIAEDDLVKEVSIDAPIESGAGDLTVLVVDCGVKHNILRLLEAQPWTLKRVPYDYDYSNDEYDAVFISNGPGDPARNTRTIEILAKALKREKPTFGICLGCQLIALAIGAETYKLPFGHRSQNQPCLDERTGLCYLSSQNHGYAIDAASLPEPWQVTYRNLNDDTVQGIAHPDLPIEAVQFHPEAAPGPLDTEFLFQRFFEQVRALSHAESV